VERRRLKAAMAGAILMCSAAPALAHPHVWATLEASIVFNDQGQISAIDIDWTFDKKYTEMALEGLDTNGDGVYSEEELAPLTRNNLDVLKDYDYFTVARLNGEKLSVGDATDYGQIWSNGKLEMHFRVPLKAPVDPRSGQFVLKVYDPDFFVDIELDKADPVDVVGTMPQGCKLDIKPLLTDAQIDQTRAMLATKGTDWKPENNEDFGAMFAQPITVDCAS